jgi:hypothetical protein
MKRVVNFSNLFSYDLLNKLFSWRPLRLGG